MSTSGHAALLAVEQAARALSSITPDEPFGPAHRLRDALDALDAARREEAEEADDAAVPAPAQSPPTPATACYADWSTADLAAQRRLWVDEKNRITARTQELDRLIARLTLALDARLKTGGPSASG